MVSYMVKGYSGDFCSMCSMHKLYARYHKISPDKLPDYSVEPEFKLNERFHPDFEKRVLSQLVNQYL